MSTFTIPGNTGQIRQDNRGDTRGELWESYNIDMASSIDKIKTSKKLLKVLDEVTDLNSSEIQAMEVYDRNFWIATDDFVYKCSVDDDVTDSTNWSKETGIAETGMGFEADMEVFGGLLLISQGTDITSWNGTADNTSWWTTTDTGTALTTLYPHMMHVHRGGQETLFVTDKNIVRYYNATAKHAEVTLQTDLVACCVSSGVSATWVGTYSESVSDAYVYEIYVGEQIDSASVARNAYKIDGRAVLAIEVIDNIPHIVTDRGHVQAFTGAGFKTVASFPFAFSSDVLDGIDIGSIQKTSLSRPVHPKGASRHNDSLYININTDTATGAAPQVNATRSPSGVWDYNTTTCSLTHKYALTVSATEYGTHVMGRCGPLMVVDTEDTLLIAAGKPEGSTNGMFAESSSTNQSYFITPEITAQTVQEAFESAYIKAKTLVSGESITLKYRTTKRDKENISATFADANVLNFTLNSNIAVGDEVTFSYGNYAGQIAHITAINNSATVTSITLDANIGTAEETAFIVIENWTEHPVEMTSADGEYKRFGIGKPSPWIQYKVVMLGNIEIRQFISKGNAKAEL